MNLMASTFLVLLAIVGCIVFVFNLGMVDSSLLVPITTSTTMRTTTIPTTTVKPFNCKRMMLSMGKRVFKMFGICNRDMKVFIPNEQERSKRIQCSVKCVLKKLSVVNEKDLITVEGLEKFFDSFLPPDYHEAAHIFTDACVEEFVEKGDAPLQEDYCESYGEFLKCMQGQFNGVC